MKKIYTTRYSRLCITLKRNGISAQIEFKNGRMNDNVPARFITSDPLLQYLIEHDSRYGNLFRLEKSIPEKKDEVSAETKKREKKGKETPAVKVVESVRDLTDAIDYFSNMGVLCTTPKHVENSMSDYKVSFPNLKL